MLAKYLESSPNITEKLALPTGNRSTKKTSVRVADAKKEKKQFLENWEMAWEEAGQSKK